MTSICCYVRCLKIEIAALELRSKVKFHPEESHRDHD